MKGLSDKAASAISKMIDGNFNSISLDFLGIVPKIKHNTNITFSTKKNSLTELFLHSLGTSKANKDEENTLKVILRIANDYVGALKDRTKAKTINNLDGYIKDRNAKKQPIKEEKLKEIVGKEMKQAKNHFKMIANSESNKASNTGTALQISKIAEGKGEDDPTVFFVVVIDERNDPETYRLHLLPDRRTPRLYKLSELGSEYHKKGDEWPKIQGTNPNCRCKISYLPLDFGFDEKGSPKFIGIDHDDFKAQRAKYGLPKKLESKKMKKSEGGEENISSNLPSPDLEHPDNINEPDTNKHKMYHTANNGETVWKPKHMKWGGRKVTPENMDSLHRSAWKGFAQKNGIEKGSDFSLTMTNLNKMIVNDNDRHLRMSKTSGHPDPKHQEMRQRHLIHALGGGEGYSIENVKHPQSGNHIGVRIKAPRHHKSGDLGETSWFYDGKSLKTEYNKLTGEKWK